MTKAVCTEAEFISLWHKYQSVQKLSEFLGINYRAVLKRRKHLEEKHDIILESLDNRGNFRGLSIPENRIRASYEIENGMVLVGSDCHYNPKYISTAHKGFVEFVKYLKPKLIVLNGDLFDFASISKHHRIGWQESPTVQEELEEVQARLGDIEKVRPAGCILHRTIGNHDLRYDGKLSNVLPQYQGVRGMALADHLPHWSYSWTLMVNENTMIKHRWHNGIHAVYNNILKGGTSFVTGHLHSLKVTPWTDYNGDRYGVDTGTMAAVDDEQFSYTEGSPVNWRAGFAILTFINGKLMPPELAQVVSEDKGHIFFRGQLIQV